MGIIIAVSVIGRGGIVTAKSDVNIESTNISVTRTFTNTFGSGNKHITIIADQFGFVSGFAGSSSNVFYIQNGNLYHMVLDDYFSTELLSTNVGGMYNDEEGALIVNKTSKTIVLRDATAVYYN